MCRECRLRTEVKPGLPEMPTGSLMPERRRPCRCFSGNSGKITAQNVTATLSCNSSYVTLLDSVISIGNIPAGVTKECESKFRFWLDKDMPELLKNNLPDSVVRFTVTIRAQGVSEPFSDSFTVDVYTAVPAQGIKRLFPEIITGRREQRCRLT